MNESRVPGFDDREKGFERKFERDQELAFKVHARRNKLLGLWAAEHLGLAGEAAETYAKNLVAAALAQPRDDAITAKIAGDFAGKGVKLDQTRIHRELERCDGEAKLHFGAAQ